MEEAPAYSYREAGYTCGLRSFRMARGISTMATMTLNGRCPLLDCTQLPRSWNPDHIDLSGLEWITPFEVAMTAAVWSRLDLAGEPPDVTLPSDPVVRAYLVDIGLNKVIPGNWGAGGGSASEPPWLKLTRLTNGNEWDEILRVLWPEASGLFDDTRLTRETMDLLGELIDNAVTHGQSDTGTFVCAQRYTGVTSYLPHGIWIGVADTGKGIPNHLRQNPKYADIEDDRKLIGLSRKPWVTGTSERRGWGLVEVFESATNVGPSRIVMRSGRGQGEFQLRQGKSVVARYRAVTPAVPGTWIHVRLESI